MNRPIRFPRTRRCAGMACTAAILAGMAVAIAIPMTYAAGGSAEIPSSGSGAGADRKPVPLKTAPVVASGPRAVFVADGMLEAVRHSVIAAQVSGRVTALEVRAGDSVRGGQTLARIDERAAAQQAMAGQAQAAAARAHLDVARREYERSQQLHEKKFISQAAMDQAEASFKANEAQARAMLAEAAAASTTTDFHTLRAPYDGVVADVTTELGDMASPGVPLMTVYDPVALRATVHLPESRAGALKADVPVRIEIPGAPEAIRWQTAQSVAVLPTADPASHTVEVRLNLAPALAGLAPGMFVRAHLPVTGAADRQLTIPAVAVIKRSELFAVYVVDAQGQPRLRQVRLGKRIGERVEVLAGLSEGERVALDPLAAARR